MCLVKGKDVLPRSQLDPLGLGAKPQQSIVEAHELEDSAGFSLDKQVSWLRGVLFHLSFIEGVCLRHRGLASSREFDGWVDGQMNGWVLA